MCVGAARDADQGGPAASERRQVDGALSEGVRAAVRGEFAQLSTTKKHLQCRKCTQNIHQERPSEENKENLEFLLSKCEPN